MIELAAIPGDPDALGSAAAKYAGFAESILAAAAQLTALANERSFRSEAIEAVGSESVLAAEAMSAVHPRYRDTATALAAYSVALRDAQQVSRAAENAARNADDQLDPLKARKLHLTEELVLAATEPDKIQQLQQQLRTIEHEIDDLESTVIREVAAFEAAVHERDVAAEQAIDRIRPAVHELADGILDVLGAAVHDVEGFLADVENWVRNVLKTVLGVLELVVLAIAVLIILQFALVAILAILIDPALAVPILLAAVLAIAAVAIPAIVALLALLLAREAATPTPTMTRKPEPKSGAPAAGINLEAGDRYEQTLLADQALDKAGGENSTDIQVIKVVGADGVTRWRVILPSTQDWEWANGIVAGSGLPQGDKGAVNDLGSNIALMLDPGMKAAYERAVIEAMHKAGVGPQDPVMLTGWSQGGILAGKMAAEVPPPFDITAIFVAGAPIDAMKIPSSVAVISVQHTGDVVPTLDLTPAHPNTQNWVTVTEAAPPHSVVHSAASYGATAHTSVDTAPAGSSVANVRDRQNVFFGTDETSTIWQGHE